MVLLSSCGQSSDEATSIDAASNGSTGSSPDSVADIIFLGDNIITMDDSQVNAVAVIGDYIAETGDTETILKLRGPDTRVIELGERALLPGFIDAHGHFIGVAQNIDILDFSSPPVGSIESIDDIVAAIREHIEDQQIPAGQWIYGFGYDDSLLAENRHPNRDDLDRASSNHPIVLKHVSGHLRAVNSLALTKVNITAQSENPEGGIIRRREGSREPDGVMEETAMRAFPWISQEIGAQRKKQLIRIAMDIYAGYGITTVQDGGSAMGDIELLRDMANDAAFSLDVVAFPSINSLSDDTFDSLSYDTTYSGGFRVGGVKFMLDGSPQGRTAWLSEPYTAGPPGAAADYRAYANYSREAYESRVAIMIDRAIPILAHANGDAAIDMMIEGISKAVTGKVTPDHRSVIIHAQLMRADQLDRVKELGIVPSYYSVHPFFWGDWHRLSFGEQRAAFISPVKATIDRGIPFTIHNDSPVVPPDIMRLIWVTVNRVTRSGYVLGPDQRATVMEALHAVTLGAAYQYFEEDEKGSITPGKRADFVILQENPLNVDVMTLADIPIVETFSRGISVFIKQ